MKKSNNGIKTVATNRKARFEYFLEESFEAGIVLKGTEVKSIRQGKVSIGESYAHIENGEIILYNLHISPYEQGNIHNVDPIRPRKLLLHKREIRKIEAAITQGGYTLIPVSMYINRGLVKVQIAIAKGKKLYDKRHDIAKRDAERRIDQQLKERYR